MNKHQFSPVAISFAVGLALSAAAAAQTTPTFSKDIAPLFFKDCATCHRPGEIAPMSLLSYQDARPWAKSIKARIASGQMPPWQSDDPHGTFLNDRRLSEAEKSLIIRWVDAGAPQGNAKDMPPAPKFPEGWQIGKPDAVFSMAKPYEVPATGTVEYQYFTVPSNFTEDKWIQAIEVRAGARSVVHHILVYAKDPSYKGPRRDAFTVAVPDMSKRQRPAGSPPPQQQRQLTPEEALRRDPGTLVGMMAPGTNPMVFKPGTAMKIPAGSLLTFQIHYTVNGKTAMEDQSSVGMIFAKTPPQQEVRDTYFANPTLVLPAGAPDVAVPSAIVFTEDSHITGMVPHTHLRGKTWEDRLVYPDGHTQVILSVPTYDFNWQTLYEFATPLAVPAGTRLETVAHYDNSANNKANPDPTKTVHWGDQTFEEMQFTALLYTVDKAPSPASQNASGGGGQ
ncbi:MAG TPA: hypothetical protein VG273_18570 [Bryobacteraceae bacterium]|jgi:hypothetical protein|nr:hypothetical protein [Bryobacteraceae bacterium]